MVNFEALQRGSEDFRVYDCNIICYSKINKTLDKMRTLEILISVQNFSIVINMFWRSALANNTLKFFPAHL